MNPIDLSPCFCSNDINSCRDFYCTYFAARIVFDCGWYLNLKIGDQGPSLQFIEPQQGMAPFAGVGVMLNFKVAEVDQEYQRIVDAGLPIVMPLEDHPWGDRGFSVVDPLGNTVYIYSDRKPTEEFKHFYKE